MPGRPSKSSPGPRAGDGQNSQITPPGYCTSEYSRYRFSGLPAAGTGGFTPGVGGSTRPADGERPHISAVSEGGLVAVRRWRLTGVALIVFLMAAVSVVALRQAVPSAHGKAAAKGAATHKPAVVAGDPDAPAGGSGQESKVGDPNSGFAGWFYGQRAYPAKH